MKRKIAEHLLNWKSIPEHKPLILQGARQVGKSYILDEFGRTCYKNGFPKFQVKKLCKGIMNRGSFVEKSRSFFYCSSQSEVENHIRL